MTVTYVTNGGDVLDELLSRHYGAELLDEALEAVWAANPGLAARGLTLPVGLTITLPELTARRAPARLTCGAELKPWIYVAGSRRADMEAVMQSLTVVDAGDVNSTTELVLAASIGRVARPQRGVDMRFTTPEGVQIGTVLQASGVGWSNQAGTTTIYGGTADRAAALHRPRDATWTEATLGDLVSTIAGRTGYEPVTAAALSGIIVDAIQVGESDLQLLERVAAQWGGRVVVRGGRLILLAAGGGSSAGSGIPLPTTRVEVDADVWTMGRVDARTIDGVAARFQTPDGFSGVVEVGEGATDWMPGTYSSRDQAMAAASQRLLDRTADDTELTVQLPLRPDLQALYPVTVAGDRIPADVEGVSLWIETVEHSMPAEGAATSTLVARPL